VSGQDGAAGRSAIGGVLVRPLTAAEQRLLVAARTRALQDCPYFAHALFSAQPLAAEGLGTFAVDASWRMYLDPSTLAQWGPEVAGGVLNHEVNHLLRDHAGRGQALGPARDHTVWNYATDAAINDDLLAAGVALPEGVVTPAGLGLEAAGIEENYYRALLSQTDGGDGESSSTDSASADGGSTDGGSTDGGCGSGAGDEPAAWELPAPGAGAGEDGEGTDGAHAGSADRTGLTAPVVGEARARVIRRTVAHDVRTHTARAGTGRGTVPAGLRRWAERELTEPVVDWRRVLSATVRRALAYRAGQVSPTYTRLPRHRLPGIVTPGSRRPQITAAVVVDTSGSVGADLLSTALAEVRGVVKACGVGERGLAVLACDAEVAATTRVRKVSTVAEDVDLAGGGGTDMRVGIAAAEALRPPPDVVVVLSDGGTPWPQVPTRSRLIVGLLGVQEDSPLMGTTPPWAQTLAIPAR